MLQHGNREVDHLQEDLGLVKNKENKDQELVILFREEDKMLLLNNLERGIKLLMSNWIMNYKN